MDWRNHITFNPEVLAGKPVVKGTRLSVEFIVGLLAQGWSEADVLRNYPGLSSKDIQACFAYASDVPSDVLTTGVARRPAPADQIGVRPR